MARCALARRVSRNAHEGLVLFICSRHPCVHRRSLCIGGHVSHTISSLFIYVSSFCSFLFVLSVVRFSCSVRRVGANKKKRNECWLLRRTKCIFTEDRIAHLIMSISRSVYIWRKTQCCIAAYSIFRDRMKKGKKAKNSGIKREKEKNCQSEGYTIDLLFAFTTYRAAEKSKFLYDIMRVHRALPFPVNIYYWNAAKAKIQLKWMPCFGCANVYPRAFNGGIKA